MEHRKKILIVNNNLNTGGVTKALVNLLNEIKETYEVTVLIFNASGEHNNSIPKEVSVIESNPYLKLLGLTQNQTRQEGSTLFLVRGLLALWTRLISNYVPIKLLLATQKEIKGYDVVISYLHGSLKNSFYGGCNEFVLKKVDASKKIGFVHCDYLEYGGNTAINKYYYKQFDSIATVSNGCSTNFVKAIPELSKNVYHVKNFHDFDEIKSLGMDDPVQYDSSTFNMVTVARLSSEKGIIRTLKAIRKLIDLNYRVSWHIVGGGPQRNEIELFIQENSLEKNVFLYGNQDNPFRYIVNADIFLLPSFHEAAPMVIDEAKSLGTPVVTTNTISAEEKILEGKEGFICENSEAAIYEKIKYLLDHPQILESCKAYLHEQEYSNKEALEQFIRLIES